jgi:uncharacterized phage protein (TIGR02220 family)
MPTRLIREGIISSERVDRLEPAAEVFYRRLLNKVDDHGLYDGRPSILRANLYPLRVDRVREADISRSLAACQSAGLIVLYENGGKPYLMALDTGWDKRSKPKYPLPPENICEQLLADPNTSTVVRSRSSLSVDRDTSGKPDAPQRSAKKAEALQVLEFLNATAGKAFRPVESNIEIIVARLTEGYTVADMRKVIVRKSDKWKGDEKMDEYLRPDTLFNKTKLAQYTGELVIPT